MSAPGVRLVLRPAFTLAAAGVLLLTGCGVGTTALPADGTFAGMTGIAHGGPNPVTGATVTLYATGSGSYGATATSLATATTDANGSFGFSGAGTCPTGQQAYITAQGGNPGSGNNPSYVLAAALGPCSQLNANTRIWIDEVTTVAAAYALSNFSTMSGTTVNVGAPAANNAPSPACSGTGSTQNCTGAGLAHAFANAVNLANSVSLNGSAQPNGQAYTVAPSNANSSVPAALINAIANSIEACVNSTGGAAGDGNACGQLFSAATPPTSSTASPTVPTNTFQALLNLAKYPTLTTAKVTAFYNIAPPTSYYQPTLSAAPVDYSMAIVYSAVNGTSFGLPFYIALDVNDRVYTSSNSIAANGPVNIFGIAANGHSLFVGAGLNTARCTDAAACQIASSPDGRLWLPNTDGNNTNVYEINSADGTSINIFSLGTGSAPTGVAVDQYNSVFVSSATTTQPNLFSANPTLNGFAFANVSAAGTPVMETNAPPAFVAFDASGNLWNANLSATAAYSNYLQNSGTTTTTFAAPPVPTTVSASDGNAYSVVIDGAGDGWLNTKSNLYELSPGGSTVANAYPISYTNPVTSIGTSASHAQYTALDGAGNIFLPDNNASGSRLWQFFPGTHRFVYLAPCSAPMGATLCGTGSSLALYGPRSTQVDSTGSLWVASSSNGAVVQIIGTASPTWPQLSYGHPGVMPQ